MKRSMSFTFSGDVVWWRWPAGFMFPLKLVLLQGTSLPRVKWCISLLLFFWQWTSFLRRTHVTQNELKNRSSLSFVIPFTTFFLICVAFVLLPPLSFHISSSPVLLFSYCSTLYFYPLFQLRNFILFLSSKNVNDTNNTETIPKNSLETNVDERKHVFTRNFPVKNNGKS